MPYTYTLADEAVSTGLPITRPLYLDYPGQAAAYDNPGEYLYGPDMLVAPVTTPGNVSKRVGVVPAGQVDGLLHRRHVHRPLDPDAHGSAGPDAGVRQGRRDHPRAGADGATSAPTPSAPTTLRVYRGGPASFSLYEDAGTGNGYEHGQDSQNGDQPGRARRGRSVHHRGDRPSAGALPRCSRARGTSSVRDRAASPSRSQVLVDGRPLVAPPAGAMTRRPTR